jgi:hypothetical protein
MLKGVFGILGTKGNDGCGRPDTGESPPGNHKFAEVYPLLFGVLGSFIGDLLSSYRGLEQV